MHLDFYLSFIGFNFLIWFLWNCDCPLESFVFRNAKKMKEWKWRIECSSDEVCVVHKLWVVILDESSVPMSSKLRNWKWKKERHHLIQSTIHAHLQMSRLINFNWQHLQIYANEVVFSNAQVENYKIKIFEYNFRIF